MRRYSPNPYTYKRLTARDYEIVKAVFEARYLTNVEIGNMFFGGKVTSQCKTRLKALYDFGSDPEKGKSGMLDKRQGYINEKDIYFLGDKGISYIAKHHPTYTRWDVKAIAGLPATTKLPNLFMEHELTLSRLYTRARVEASELGYNMMWKNTAALRRERLGFYPDAWLKVYNGSTHEAYLEFTADLTSVAKKPSQYDRYLPDAWVLWVTTSLDKLDKIGTAIAGSKNPGRFWVALLEDCKGFLSQPMWLALEGRKWRSRRLMGGS